MKAIAQGFHWYVLDSVPLACVGRSTFLCQKISCTCKKPYFDIHTARPRKLCLLVPLKSGQQSIVAGSEDIAALALKVRPRYHVAAKEGIFFARVPYINKDLGAGARFLHHLSPLAQCLTNRQHSVSI